MSFGDALNVGGCALSIACSDIGSAVINWPLEVAGYIPIVGTFIAVGRITVAAAVAFASLGELIIRDLFNNRESCLLWKIAKKQALTGIVELVPFIKLMVKITECIAGSGLRIQDEKILGMIIRAPYIHCIAFPPNSFGAKGVDTRVRH